MISVIIWILILGTLVQMYLYALIIYNKNNASINYH